MNTPRFSSVGGSARWGWVHGSRYDSSCASDSVRRGVCAGSFGSRGLRSKLGFVIADADGGTNPVSPQSFSQCQRGGNSNAQPRAKDARADSISPTQAPPTPKPTAPAPTVAPAPAQQAQNLCGAPANPWGYNFCGGSFITNPAATICNYFNCIASFWNGRGYVMECSDTTFGKSGGISGSCSSHGGNYRALRAP
jgi:hypothetical protein